ncbi:MAG: CPBP family intramembrane metalloprotease [Prolixibacteraceae bacterium]|nr:CPBP family intramembrane metalloprotease [Prolixibacteraceae bacterium]
MKTLNKTTLFLILTFTISFLLAGIYKLAGGTGPGTGVYTLFGAFYMFIPTICALLVKRLIHKENASKDLMVSFKINRWFFVAWFLMPVIIFSTLGLNILFPNVSFNPEMTGFLDRFKDLMTPEELEQAKQSMLSTPIPLPWIMLFMGLFAGITVNGLAAFGEELGWRGFLLKSFQHMSFGKASLTIGLIWGIWHAPLILMGHNYPQHPEIGVFMMIALCTLLTPFLLYITIKSKSVIAAAIMHGTMNATAGISIMAIDGGNDLTSGIAGLAGFITLAVFLTGLFIFDRFVSKDNIFSTKIADHL